MKALRWTLVVVGLVALVVALRLTVLRPKPVRVRTAAVERGTVEETVSNTRAGTVKVRRRASLSPQIGGLVVELPFREGDRVAPGELLLRLDDQAQRAGLELARRSIALATAQADEACLAATLAEKELKRVSALHHQGIASEQSLDTLSTERDRSVAACAAARAAVAQSQAQVALSEVELGFTELRAPFSGVIAELSTEVGEWITPSPPGVPIPPVIDLIDSDSLYVSAPIDEVDSERVGQGQPVRVTVDSRPGQDFEGRVARVAPFVLDRLEQNRTVEVEVEFSRAAAARGVLPGTSADVEIILDRRDQVPRIPAQAVGEGGKVLVLEAGALGERIITVGLSNWQWAEVRDGVVEGELVVMSRASADVKAGASAVSADGGAR
jgi:HlyD family secretion protein